MRTKVYCIAILLLLALLAGCVAPPVSAPAAEVAASSIQIEHERGTLTLAAPVERVAVLDYSFLDSMLALELKPVGAALDATGGDRGVPPYLAELAAGLESAGARPQPNLEKLVTLKPQVIIADAAAQADFYDQLNQIAPTVLFNSRRGTYDDLMQQLVAIGTMTGKAAEAQAVVDAQAQLVTTAKAQANVDAPPLVVAVATGEGLTVHSTTSFVGSLLEQLGRKNGVEPQADASQFEVSFEGLAALNPQTLVFFTGANEVPIVREWSQNPIWNQLEAVKRGRVYEFDRDLWTRGRGPIALKLIVNEAITSGLLGDDEPTAQFAFRSSGEGGAVSAALPGSLQLLATTADYRLVQDALGEKQVPLTPQCIVAAGSGYLDHLLALGVQPCGAAHGPGGSGFPDHLADQLVDVAYVGGTLEINLEAVAALDPDLILAMHPAHTEGDFKTLLDPIATTVYLTEPWQDWRRAMNEIALLLGKEEVAQARLAAFDQKLADAKTQLAEWMAGEKVMFLRVFPEKLRIYGVASPTGDILYRGLGLTPATLTPADDHATEITLELLPEIDADHIFLLDQTEDGMAAIQANPLWQRLTAVQNNQVYPVDVKVWVQGEGLFAYDVLIDDVLAALNQ